MEDLHNTSFEQSILSSILFNKELFKNIKNKLSPEDFYLKSHQDIYRAFLNINASNNPLDEDFVIKELKKNKLFDEDVMMKLISHNPIANIDPYLEQVKELSNKRNLFNIANELKSQALDLNYSSIQIATYLKDRLDSDIKSSTPILTPAKLSSAKSEDTEFICKSFLPLPKKAVSLINAAGGTGKSFVALHLGLNHLRDDLKHKVFLWLSEDNIGLTHDRAKKICTDFMFNSELLDRLDVADDMPKHFTEMIKQQHQVTSAFYEVKNILKDYDLIILDPLIAFFGGDENNNSHARQFFDLFGKWVREENKVIVFLHHSTKGKDNARGAGSITDAARLSYNLSKSDKPNCLSFQIAKDNYGASYINNTGLEFYRKIFPMRVEYKKATDVGHSELT